jgi:hypothetical protein
MQENRLLKRWMPIFIILLVSSCAGETPASPDDGLSITDTPPPQPASPTPAEYVSSPVAENRPSPSPSLTQTLASTGRPLNAEGPWILMQSGYGLWILNPDGSGMKQVAEVHRLYDDVSVSAGRGSIAYVDYDGAWYLYEMMIPDGAVSRITPLIPDSALDLLYTKYPDWEPGDDPEAASSVHIEMAVMRRGSVSWSTRRDLLAFSGALDSYSTDLYLYDPTSQSIERLSDGPSQVVDISWSPDDRYIVYTGASITLPRGGESIYPAGAKWVYDRRTKLNRMIQRGEIVKRWLSNTGVMSYYVSIYCGYGGLIVTDVQMDEYWPANPLDCIFSDADMDPVTETRIISIPLVNNPADMCEPWKVHPDTGFYFYQKGNLRKLENFQYDDDDLSYAGIFWSPEAGVFVLTLRRQVILMDTGGRIVSSFPMDAAGEIFWSADGETMYFVSGNTGDLYMASRPDFRPVQITDGVSFGDRRFEWVL